MITTFSKKFLSGVFISSLYFAAMAFITIAPAKAYALSCLSPQWSQDTVDAASMIFEGVAGDEQELSPDQQKTLDDAGLAAESDAQAKYRLYNFTVMKNWKGAKEEERYPVLLNTYWGDNFIFGKPYLVVTEAEYGGLYEAPLCGNTIPLDQAVNDDVLDTLVKLIPEPILPVAPPVAEPKQTDKGVMMDDDADEEGAPAEATEEEPGEH